METVRQMAASPTSAPIFSNGISRGAVEERKNTELGVWGLHGSKSDYHLLAFSPLANYFTSPCLDCFLFKIMTLD